MGKQHSKIVKRARRKQYLKRKKEQVKAAVTRSESSPTKKVVKKAAVKKVAKKATAKKAVKKTVAKKVAKKATVEKKNEE